MLEPGPSVLHLADSWMAGAHLCRDHEEPESDDDVESGSEDEGVNEGSSGLREGDWSYSAENFSDLKTYMFIDSSDEEFLRISNFYILLY